MDLTLEDELELESLSPSRLGSGLADRIEEHGVRRAMATIYGMEVRWEQSTLEVRVKAT